MKHCRTSLLVVAALILPALVTAAGEPSPDAPVDEIRVARFAQPGYPEPPLQEDVVSEAQFVPERVYHWQSNLSAFLDEAFLAAGFEEAEAAEYAARARRLINPKFEHQYADPQQILRYVFQAVLGGSEARAADLAMAVEAVLSDRFGVLMVEERPADLPPAGAEPGTSSVIPINTVAIHHWQNNLAAFFDQAFEMAGLEEQQAADAATIARDLMDLRYKDSKRYRDTDWENANPQALLVEAFRLTGFGLVESIVISEDVLSRLGVAGWHRPRVAAVMDTCPAYRVLIIWCENGQQHTETTYMFRNSWESLVLACPASGTCPLNEDDWYTLTLAGDCVPDAPEDACVWLRAISGLMDRDCEEVTIDLDCFTETTGTIQCSEIELKCGDPDHGPSGCPDCGDDA